MRVYIVYNLSIKDACYLWVGYCLGAVHWTELQNISQLPVFEMHKFLIDLSLYVYFFLNLSILNLSLKCISS